MNRENARGLAQLAGAVSSWKKWATAIGVVLLGATTLAAQISGRQNRISQNLTSKPNVALSGTVHPLTAKSTDLGAVNSNMQLNSMTLHVKPSAAQKKEIAALLVSLQDRKSPQYHKWLTQADYGARFGLTASDLSQLKSWITGQGFAVKHVSTSRNSITFSGKAWQAESAFHTQLHQYKLDGETHFANATALQIPAQFADVVLAVRGLDNFRPKPNAKRMLAQPNATFGTSNFISPADWATIYSVSSLYTNGFDGTGVHVGIVGQSYAPQADIDNFRAASGLLATKLTYACISTAVSCTDAASISSTGDLAEADLDIEWAGGIAQNATVDYIYTAADDTQSVFDSLSYAVGTYLAADGNPVPVISMSYNFGCEANLPGVILDLFDALVPQAIAQGQTVVVPSGDSGAAGCDAPFAPGVTTAAGGLSVTVPADNPNFTAVGGTMFSGDLGINQATYWDMTDGLVPSALSYIPESAWNESGVAGLAAGGGGESTATVLDPITGLPILRYPTPDWQIGQLGATPTSGRLVPDVAFASASGHDGYLYCSSDPVKPNLCTNSAGGYFSSGGTPATAGGTSVATPSFAGLLTLFVQRYGPLGNVNPALYAAANASYGTTFNDIQTGDTNVPCVAGTTGCVGGVIGFAAGPGYDQATGLGSVIGDGMFAALSGTYTVAASTTALSAAPNPVTFGSSVTLTATVTSPVSGTAGTPTGTVTFSTAAGPLGADVTLDSTGVATLSNVPTTALGGLGVGIDTITAAYSGDANYVKSAGITPLTVLGILPTVTLTPSLTSITTTQVLTVAVAVSGTSGNPTPTGSVVLAGGGFTSLPITLVGGSATITVPAGSLTAGADTLTVTYTPDTASSSLYSSASGTTVVTVALKTPPITLTPTPTSITTAQTLSVKIGVSGGPTPTGSVILSSGTYTSTPQTLSGGFNTITVPAGALAVGTDTLTATYTPDAASSSVYSSASGTATVVVAAVVPTYTLSASTTSVHGSSPVVLTLTSTAYTGTVSLVTSVTSTNGTASNVSAALAPPSVLLTAGGTPGTSTLTITASANAANHAPAVPWKSGGALVFCAVLLGAPFGRRKRVVAVLLTALAISLAGLLMACGGGGSKTPPTPAARTYTVTVTPTSSPAVLNPPAPVVITVTVP
jgi:hypothetical protein